MDDDQIASPDAEELQNEMSDDNASMQSVENSIASPEQMDEGSCDNVSESECRPLKPPSPETKPLTPSSPETRPLTPASPDARPLTPSSPDSTPLTPQSPETRPLTPPSPETRPPLTPPSPETKPPLTPPSPETRPLTPPSPNAPFIAPPTLRVTDTLPEKVENANSQMDSKTVETLEGELDFEEEIHEKDEREESPQHNKEEIDEPLDEGSVIIKVEQKKTDEEKLDDDQDEGEICSEELNKIEQEEGEADDGEVTDEDDLEEGEVKDGASVRKSFPRPVCRFFNKGQCTWGSSCRFIHPGVNDKGNYNMFSPSKPSHGMMMGGPPMPPLPPPMMKMPMPLPRMRPMMGPDYRPPPQEDAPPVESAWERGLRHAKEILKKASRRKEQEPDFEDKRMNLSLETSERPNYDYEREAEKFPRTSPYRRFSDSFNDEGPDPYDLADREHQEMFRGGRFENFEVRWNRQDYEYRDFHEKERGRRFSRSMEREKYERRSPVGERWQDERYGEPQPSRGRADEWRDPWRRSKTPKGRRSRSQARSGRRSYSSGSSRSFSSRSSRSSYSYSRSSSSKSSHFTSERSRSRSHSHPRVPSRQGGGVYYGKSPPKIGEKDMYEPRRKAPPRAPQRTIPGSMGGPGQPGIREHPIRSPTMARNSSPPTRPPPRKGPSPVRKVVNISPLSKFSPSQKMTPPRKPGTPTKLPPSSKPTPPGNIRRKGAPGEGPMSPNRRVGPGPPKEDRKNEGGKIVKNTERRSRKSRSASFSGSATSRSPSRTPSRSSRSHSSSQSRSRSRSFSRSVSMSSVSSASSSGSHSSSDSLGGTKKKTKSAKPTPGGPGAPFKRDEGRTPPLPPPLPPATARSRPAEPKTRDRSREVKARNTERRYDEYDEQLASNASYSGDRSSSALTIPLLVSKQSKDLLKQSGQKPQIKLTLLSKAQKHSSIVDKTLPKPEPPKAKHEREEVPRSVKPPKSPSPPPPIHPPLPPSGGQMVSRKRHASTPPPPLPPTIPKSLSQAGIISKLDLKKSSSTRREELLKQLKAVEDAIARKRSKLS